MAPVPVREVNQISMLHHVDPPNKDHCALSALDVHRLPLVCMDDMLLQVSFVPKLLPTQFTHGFLWRRFSGYFSLMLFFVTREGENK